MKRHPSRGLSVATLLLMLSAGAANAGTLALWDGAAPFEWKARESTLAVEDPGLTVEDKVTLVAPRVGAAISDEDDCTMSVAGRAIPAVSGRCTRG